MNRVFKTDLSVNGLRKLKKDIRAYQRQTLPNLLREYISRLADDGIYIAKLSAGYSEFAPYVVFVKEFKDSKYLYNPTVILVGKNAIPCIKQWFRDNELIEKEVNAIMMLEYGSGQFAKNGYRGTFPDQIHAKENSWWYATERDSEGNFIWHYADGERASQPMIHARDAIIKYADREARRVFG